MRAAQASTGCVAKRASGRAEGGREPGDDGQETLASGLLDRGANSRPEEIEHCCSRHGA
jgi:hypothetical protein